MDWLAYIGLSTILLYAWRIHDYIAFLRLLPLFSISSLGLLLLYAADKDARRRLRNLKNPITTAVIGLSVMMVLSIPASVYRGLSFSFVFQDHFRTLLVVTVLAATIRSFADVKRATVVHVLGAAVTGLVVAPHYRAGRFFMGYYDRNDFGMMWVCAIPLALYLARSKKTSLKILGFISVSASMLGIISSASRGAFLALVVLSLFLLVSYNAIRSWLRIGGVILGCVVIVSMGSEDFWARMQTILHPEDDYNWAGAEESGRIEVWKRGFGYLVKRPLTGVGAAAFGVAEGTISPMASDWGRGGRGIRWATAHNSYVQIGAELGVPGILFFLAVLFYSCRVCWRIGWSKRNKYPDDARALAQSLLGVLVAYMVAGGFLSQGYSKLLYFILAVVIGLDRTVTSKTTGPGLPQPATRRPQMVPAGRGGQLVAMQRSERTSIDR